MFQEVKIREEMWEGITWGYFVLYPISLKGNQSL